MNRIFKNRLMQQTMFFFSWVPLFLLFFISSALFIRSIPILRTTHLPDLLFNPVFRPFKGQFGFWPFISGTFWITGTAIFLAVPLALLSAIFLSEYASSKIRSICNPFFDLLSGIPSVVYGIWGVLFLVPLVKNYFAPLFGKTTTGYCVLSGGMVLAVMIIPLIVHVTVEVLRSVPREIREASWALGATRFQTIKKVVLPKAMPGIMAAIVLGLSRAFGETMAVLMVAGNVPFPPASLFDPAYPLPALIANNYGEMMSIPNYDSALLLASFILLVIVFVFNSVSRIFLLSAERSLRGNRPDLKTEQI